MRVNLGKRVSVWKYVGMCPKHVHRYFLGEKKKNGLKLHSDIIDGVICSKDGTRHRIEEKQGNNHNVEFSRVLIRGKKEFLSIN